MLRPRLRSLRHAKRLLPSGMRYHELVVLALAGLRDGHRSLYTRPFNRGEVQCTVRNTQNE